MNCIKCGTPLGEGFVFCLKCGEYQKDPITANKDLQAKAALEPKKAILEPNYTGSPNVNYSYSGSSLFGKINNLIFKFRLARLIIAIIIFISFPLIINYGLPLLGRVYYNLNINKINKVDYHGFTYSIPGKYLYTIKDVGLNLMIPDQKWGLIVNVYADSFNTILAKKDEYAQDFKDTGATVKSYGEKIMVGRSFLCYDMTTSKGTDGIACFSKANETKTFALLYSGEDGIDAYQKMADAVPILDSAKLIEQ